MTSNTTPNIPYPVRSFDIWATSGTTPYQEATTKASIARDFVQKLTAVFHANYKNTKKSKTAVLTRGYRLDREASGDLDLDARIVELETELESAEAENSALQNDLDDLRRENDKIEAELADAQTRVLDLESEASERDERIDELKDEVRALKSKIAKLQEDDGEDDIVYSVYYTVNLVEHGKFSSWSDERKAHSVASSLIDPDDDNYIPGITSVEVRKEFRE